MNDNGCFRIGILSLNYRFETHLDCERAEDR